MTGLVAIRMGSTDKHLSILDLQYPNHYAVRVFVEPLEQKRSFDHPAKSFHCANKIQENN